MGSPRQSPCLGYLLATLLALSISLQCVDSSGVLFNVQTKFAKKPFPRSHHLHRHDRMLLGPSPIDLQTVGGNSTVPLYTMDVGIGTPPQMKKFMVDTGSSAIWVNCKGCVNCKLENKTLGLHLTPFDPALSTTNKLRFPKNCQKDAEGRCGFLTTYGLGTRKVIGYKMEDEFQIGNPATGVGLTANIRFACATEHVYDENSDGNDFLHMGIDGIMGLGNFRGSLLDQLNFTGASLPVLAQCTDNIHGGGIFAIGHVLEPKVPMNPMLNNDYLLDLFGMDFGGEEIKLYQTPEALFDSGSDKLYVPDSVLAAIDSKLKGLLAAKNATIKTNVNVDEQTCFKLPGKDLSYEVVVEEFPLMNLRFAQSVLSLTPRNYLSPCIGCIGDVTLKDYWCLHVGNFPQRWGDRDVFLIGGVLFNVQTKFAKKPFPRSHHLQRHDRMLLSPSPVDLQIVGGNSTVPLYIMEVGVGTPPQMKKFMVDTGSSEIWVNCKGCETCKLEDKALGLHLTPFDPALSMTNKLRNYTKDCRKDPEGRCGFLTTYGVGTRKVIGYKMEDEFQIGNPATGEGMTAHIKFACATKQIYDENSDGKEFLYMGIDGVMGLGNFPGSLLDQLNSSGASIPVLAQCTDNINGGGIFAIGHVVEPTVPMNPTLYKDYLLDLLGMDFGGEEIKLNGIPETLFDSGSDKLYVPDSVLDALDSKLKGLLATKNAIVKTNVNLDERTCFKLPGRDLSYEVVVEEFPTMHLLFEQSVLNLTARNYLSPYIGDVTLKDYWCLHVGNYSERWDDRDVVLVGGAAMSQKLVVYDNLNYKLGFVDHDCSVPIKVEGVDGKPVLVGPH